MIYLFRSQAVSLVVCSKYKEMYGKILKSHTIVKLYRRMSKLKVEINVNLPQLLCIAVSGALNGEFERTKSLNTQPGGGVLPYMGNIGMCGPKGYGFSIVLVINRVSILADVGHFGHK